MCKKPWMRQRMLLLCLLPMLSLSACADPTPPAVIVKDSGCRVFRSITWEPADTRKTIELIRSHNAKLWSLCGKKRT